MKLEICCGNVDSVKAAVEGGADRVELCRDLELDGLTPSREMIREAVSICHPAGVVVHVLIRSREGNFVYVQDEVDQMSSEIRMAIEEGADGVVIGALTSGGDIDVEAIRMWISQVPTERNITFHRAFDVCCDPFKALEQIISLGCNRILTSGQQPTAEAGIPLLKELVSRAENRITILCGAGVNTENAARILKESGATEIHGSLRTGLVTDPVKVKTVKASIR